MLNVLSSNLFLYAYGFSYTVSYISTKHSRIGNSELIRTYILILTLSLFIYIIKMKQKYLS